MSAVTCRPLSTLAELRAAAGLLADVWGRNEEGSPIPSEVLISLVHAGGLVNGAFDPADPSQETLLGTAVLGRSRPQTCYGYIAAARPGAADRGIGFALKQHQRSWALAEGLTSMVWTFDPLVARNARFNLTKLGAEVGEYAAGFYGVMTDDINGSERADRLVPVWRLDSERAEQAAAGRLPEPPSPPADARRLGLGPDSETAYVEAAGHRWLRVPADIVAVRRSAPALAADWRDAVAGWLSAAFADGWQAVGFTRGGCYHLTPKE